MDTWETWIEGQLKNQSEIKRAKEQMKIQGWTQTDDKENINRFIGQMAESSTRDQSSGQLETSDLNMGMRRKREEK